MFTESLTLKGKLEVSLFDENNNLKDQRKINNLVVATGKDFIASRMAANTTNIMSHMSIGTGNVAAATNQTLLVGEIGKVSLDSTSTTSNTVTFVATFPAGTGTGTLAEAGIFNAAGANTGTMLCRTRFDELNKGASDVVVISWNVTVE